MTAVCVYALTESTNFASELRLAKSDNTNLRRHVQQLTDEVERTKSKLDRLVDAHIVGVRCCPKCGSPMDKWNTYVCNGKDYCRECHRQRSKMYRARRREYADLPFAVARGKVTT